MYYPEINKLNKTLQLEGEIWKDIVGHENYYQVSNMGRVKRLSRTQMNSNQTCEFPVHYPEMVMIASCDSRGYPQVTLTAPRRVARVHRLVAEAFLEPPSQALIENSKLGGLDYVLVNHIDENPLNPAHNNLEWCTTAYNNSYGEKDYSATSGSNHYFSSLTEHDVLEIINLLQQRKLSQEKIAALYGVKQITISNIATGRSWTWLTGKERVARTRKPKPKSSVMSEQVLIVKENNDLQTKKQHSRSPPKRNPHSQQSRES